jgi:plasmid stabilization system protein ParE
VRGRYRVRITAAAQGDVESIHDYIALNAPRTADAWIGELDRQIQALEQFPMRCAVIPEATELGREYRHLIYGRYRTILRVEGRVVWIVRVIHGAQLLDTEVLET